MPVAALSALGREHDLPVLHDLGSGALVDLSRWGLPHEPTVGESIAHGADVVAFSGDKLLGGPQCGILVGRKNWIAAMGAHPLFRALRADKMTLAALEATLRLYDAPPATLQDTLPVLRMLTLPIDHLERRARRLHAALAALPGVCADVADGVSFTGGGSLPEVGLPTRVVRVRVAGSSADELARTLRHNRPAVLGAIADDWLTLDPRTLADDHFGQPDEIETVARAFARLESSPR